METTKTSMKWRRPSQVIGISTQSSKYQLHRRPTNRSGMATNSAAKPDLPSFETHRKRPRPADPTIEESLVDNVLHNTPIKDLRVKRVFPQISNPPENVTYHLKLGIGINSPEAEGGPTAAKNHGFENSANGFSSAGRDMDDSESKASEKLKMGVVSEAQKSDFVSLKFPVSEGIGGRSSELEQIIGDSGQGYIQKSSADVNTNGVRLNIDKIETKVLKHQKRVFNAPGSFAYRRLLPYLRDMAKDTSSMLEFCEQPNLVKCLEGKPLQGMRATENQAGWTGSINEHKLSRQCPTSLASSLSETVQVSPHETCNPTALSISPSTAVVDECQSKPHVDGQIENIDTSVSCKVQKLKVSGTFSPLTMEDSVVNKDHVIGMYINDNTPVEDVGAADNAGNIFRGEAENLKDQLSLMKDECCLWKQNELAQNYENSGQSPDEVKKKIDFVHPCRDQNLNHINEHRVHNSGEILNQMDDPNEESLEMTPPDAEILGKLEVKAKRIFRAGCVVQSPDQGLGKSSTGSNHRDATTWADVTPQQSSPKSTPVLKPCSRLKLFKSPDSLSYRRLLPFLMDMKKKNSGAKTDKDHSEHQIYNPVTVPAPQLTAAYSSSKDGGQNLASTENLTEIHMPFDLQKEQHIEQAVSGKQNELETSTGTLSSKHETDPPVASLCPSTSGATCNKDVAISLTNPLSHHPEEDCIRSKAALSNGEKPVQADSLFQNSSQADTTVSSGIHALGPRKGIIKRNPRGCRGLCTCLNCASFRLHAERAFEFSRNQMLDAEQIAFDLMKELSSLRNLIEFSAAGANNDHIMNLNEVQEACRKASEAEGLARNRLGEMNYDLNIHCRVTCVHEPRVTFSDHIEESHSRTKFSSN